MSWDASCEEKVWCDQRAVPCSRQSRWAPRWALRLPRLSFTVQSCSFLRNSARARSCGLCHSGSVEQKNIFLKKGPAPSLNKVIPRHPCNYRSHELWLNLWFSLAWSFLTQPWYSENTEISSNDLIQLCYLRPHLFHRLFFSFYIPQ